MIVRCTHSIKGNVGSLGKDPLSATGSRLTVVLAVQKPPNNVHFTLLLQTPMAPRVLPPPLSLLCHLTTQGCPITSRYPLCIALRSSPGVSRHAVPGILHLAASTLQRASIIAILGAVPSGPELDVDGSRGSIVGRVPYKCYPAGLHPIDPAKAVKPSRR